MGLIDDAELLENENFHDPFSSMISPTIIKVIGIGGAGCKAVNRMVEQHLNGVEFMTINTDIQDLQTSRASKRIPIGKNETRGLGAGGDPERGKRAAEESREEIKKELSGANMVFITAGMGGGTGTGAAPIVASITKELNILTVAIVTTPFEHEGPKKAGFAEEGIEKLRKEVDSIIVIPNRKLAKVLPPDISMKDALLAADSILRDGILGMAKIISEPGDMNIDFADVRSILKNSGHSYIGIGKGEGETQVIDAINMALNNQIIEDDNNINTAKGVIINIEADPNFSMKDFKEICDQISQAAGKDAIVKQGLIYNKNQTNTLKITLLTAGGTSSTDVEKKNEDNFFKNKLNDDMPDKPVYVNATEWGQLQNSFNNDLSLKNPLEYPSSDMDSDIPAVLRTVLGKK